MSVLVNVTVATSIGVLIILLIVFISRLCCCISKRGRNLTNTTTRNESLRDGINRLHHVSLHHHQIDLVDKSKSTKRPNFYAFRRGVSAKPLFNWDDHPSLVTDAVENGWSCFAFAAYNISSPSTKSILGLCAIGDERETEPPEISWEVCQASADFMQKIRLNSGLKKINNFSASSMAVSSVIRTGLPLPGPPLGNSSFPQEAYFEITILGSREDDFDQSIGKSKDGERTKLIRENSNVKVNSDSLIHVSSSAGNLKLEELKLAGGNDDGKGEIVMLSLGLTGGGSLPSKLPGSYPGSIGFNSNGSVFLDGIKLVFESEKAEWGRKDKVIGCGFNPSQRKVFFTVDSELVHVINCKSEEFGTPLYPTLAANADVSVVVNFGQSAFTYPPANSQRTPNPCFIGPLVNSPALNYEDSKELFSMGRIDSQWLNRSTTKHSYNNGSINNNNKAMDFDEESEADLFEIVLDSRGRSPNTVL